MRTRKTVKKKNVAARTAVAVLLLGAAVSGGIWAVQFTKDSDSTPTLAVSEAPVTETPLDGSADGSGGELKEQLPFLYPLTGIPAAVELTERPIMIMIENTPAARPQSGLDQADLVYEILAEGSITRFVAVYQSKSPSVIGPVRSIRPYYVEIGEGHDAVIVHAGWSPDAMNMLSSRKLNHLDQVYGDDAYYWRSKERKMPHNLYTSIELIRKGAETKKFRTAWQHTAPKFVVKAEGGAAEPVAAGIGTDRIAAAHVEIPYIQQYRVGYDYDAETKLYKRRIGDNSHVDKETGEGLTAANILVCKTKHKVLDNEGRRAVDVHGPGTGYLIQEGQAREIMWKRDGGIIRPYTTDGVELELIPGQTWVQVVPESSNVTFEG